MGANADACIEVQLRAPFNPDSPAHWYHFATITVSRDYRLYGLIAGIRSENEPPVLPRGLPDDMDDTTADAMECLTVGQGWLTLVELQDIWVRYQIGGKDNPELRAIIAAMEQLGQNAPTRLVFGFDQG